jgi:predicted metal-dependent peptidase
MDSTRLKVAQFRTTVKEILPYFTGYVYGMLAVEKPGIGTMAIDITGKMYFDPSFVARISIKQGRYVVCHEALHIALGHAPLARRVLGPKPTQQMLRWWNEAADCVVNQILMPWWSEAPSHAELGGEMVSHISLGLPAGLTVTQYYDLLAKQGGGDDGNQQQEDDDDNEDTDEREGGGEVEREDGDEGQSDSGDSEPEDDDGSASGDPSDDGEESDEGEGDADAGSSADDAGRPSRSGGSAADEPSSARGGDQPADEPEWNPAGGSGADGYPRGYEDEPDPSHRDRQYSMTEDLEQRCIEAEASSPGSVPGALKAALDMRLRPQADPLDVLRATVARAVASPVGAPDYTLKKFSRRQQHDMPRLRGIKTEMPSVVVILDTSGSMKSGKRVEQAMDVIAKAVRRLRSAKVICYDAALHDRRHVTSMSSFCWQGGGGTDMAAAIEQVDKEDRPDAIVMVTDCETGWPSRQPRARVVVAAVGAHDHYLSAVPAWARLCDLSKGGG